MVADVSTVREDKKEAAVSFWAAHEKNAEKFPAVFELFKKSYNFASKAFNFFSLVTNIK